MVRGPDGPRARWSEGPIVRVSEDYMLLKLVNCPPIGNILVIFIVPLQNKNYVSEFSFNFNET